MHDGARRYIAGAPLSIQQRIFSRSAASSTGFPLGMRAPYFTWTETLSVTFFQRKLWSLSFGTTRSGKG